MPTLEDLKVKPGMLIRSSTWNKMVDWIENLKDLAAVTYEGYVRKDLIPDPDLAVKLGTVQARFLEVHAGHGYFAYDVFVAGKPVSEIVAAPGYWSGGYVYSDIIPEPDLAIKLGLASNRFLESHIGYGYFTYEVFIGDKKVLKDGDPVYIADFYPEAKSSITQAIDDSYVKQIDQKLDEILGYVSTKGIPSLLGYQVSYDAPENTDIFDPDLVVNYDGRVRFKLTLASEAYVYTKWTPSGLATAIISSLNAGYGIPRDAWHEFDFTVMKGDKVNVRVIPGATITIFVYNIRGT